MLRVQTPQRRRSRVTATCWEVTPPWDTDMDVESRNLPLKLTSCQGKRNSELQGFHSFTSWFTVNLSHPRATAGAAQGTSILRAPLGTSTVHYGQDHNQNKPFFSTKQRFHHLHTRLQTPDLFQSQTQPRNSISGFFAPRWKWERKNFPWVSKGEVLSHKIME